MEKTQMEIYKAVFEAAPDPILFVDKGGQIVQINTVGEKTLGYGHGELIGKPIEFLIPARFRAAHVGHREGFMAEPRTRPMGAAGMELFAIRKDGTEFPVDVMLSAAQTRLGKVVIAIMRDMTESKRTAKRLEDMAERVRLSTDAAGMGYWTYDVATGETWCDPVCATLFGGCPEDFPHVDAIRKRIVPEDWESRRQRAMESIRLKGRYESEFRVINPDGSIRWLGDFGRLVSAEGEPLRFAGVTFDISWRKDLEERQATLLRKLQETLSEVKVLKGLLPVCSHCKKIRDEHGEWQQMEVYIHDHSGADFSHSICPACLEVHYPGFLRGGATIDEAVP
jgi:PAS domain S-box-containing protein